MAVHEVQVYDALRLTETVVQRPRVIFVNAGDLLRFTENRKATNPHRFVTHTLAAREQVGVALSGQRDVVDTLTFTERAERIREGWAYQNLPIAQSAAKWREAGDSLGFTETVAVVTSHGAGSFLSLYQTVVVGFQRLAEVGETLAFRHAATAYIDDPRVVIDPTVPPGARPGHTVTLATDRGSMVLPAPDFDDAEELTEQRVNRRSMGGTLIVYHDPMWFESDTFEIAFSYLSEAQVQRLRVLVAGSLGRLVTFTDHEGNAWQCVVTNPELTVTQAGRHNYHASFKILVAS